MNGGGSGGRASEQEEAINPIYTELLLLLCLNLSSVIVHDIVIVCLSNGKR